MDIFSNLPSDPQEAIAILRQACVEYPNVAEVHFELGERLFQIANDMHDDEALKCWETALMLKPDWPSVYPEWTQALRLIGGRIIHKLHNRDLGRRVIGEVLRIERETARTHPLGGLGFRILSNYNNPYNIGHCALETDLFLKMTKLGWKEAERGVLIVERAPANQCLLDYWKEYVSIVQSPAQVRDLLPLRKWMQYDSFYVALPDGRVITSLEAMPIVQKEWEKRGLPPLLRLTSEHAERGWQVLRGAGIPRDAWFVCVHARESGFYNDAHGQTGQYRNVDIHSYELAVKAITERGGWVVRVGESSVCPMPPWEKTFDYARSSAKSDWMDVFLCAQCHFFLGSTSGLMNVPSVFGRPCAITNWSVLHSLPCFSSDIFILKHPYLHREGERVPVKWSNLVHPPYAVAMDDELAAMGYEMLPNTRDEVRDLAVEMLDRLDGSHVETEEDIKLQTKMRELFDSQYSTGSACKFGASFLRNCASTFLS